MRAILLLALLTVTGCGVAHKAPVLIVTEARVVDESSLGMVVAFGLDATNLNTDAVPLREVRYALTLDGREAFRGVRGGEATIRRFGTQRITLPAALTLGPESPRPSGVVEYELSGTLSYIAPGRLAQILFDTGFSRPSVPFHITGRIDMGPEGAARTQDAETR
jgi:hypothetical protein